MNSKKQKTFLKSFSIVFFIGILGKILGFLKQIVLASYFGTSSSMDLFFTSYFFISEISVAFFSGITIVLIILYNKLKNENSDENNKLFSSTLIFFGVLSIIIILLLVCKPHLISNIISPGYNDELKEQLTMYIRLMAPIVLLYCVQVIFNAYSEAEKDFLPSKFSTIFLNILIMLFTILFSRRIGMISLVYAIICAYIFQLILSLIRAKKYIKFKLVNPFKNSNFKKLLALFGPIFIGNAIIELNSIVDRAIATNVDMGIVSAITYGASLNEIVTVLIIGTLSSVYYSYVSQLINIRSKDETVDYTKKIINKLSLIILPLQIYFIFFAKNIVTIVYMRGSFDSVSVYNTYLVVIGYALGFIFVMIRNILTRLHYAFEDTKSPMINGIVTVITNIIFSVLLSIKFGTIGIPLATSISYIISAIISYCTIKKHIDIKFEKCEKKYMIKLFLMQLILIVLSILLRMIGITNILAEAVIAFIMIIAVYTILLKIMNIDFLDEIIYKCKKLIFQKNR